jgi:hypothetical protein|tara:strand:+ start:125 stop:1201 length:1077 start_codon:yes stop_codon:yes gene_type:complete
MASLTLALAFTLPQVAWSEPKSFEPNRKAWGHPDIEGLWDFRNLTPLERPAAFADKATLTPEEAEAFRKLVLQAVDVDNRTGEATVDVEGAYNSFWWDWGTELREDLRTSLIIDPPNGRLPDITLQALARLEVQNRLRTPPVRDFFSYSANVSVFRPEGPESLGLSERCLVGFNAGPPLNPSAYNNNLRIVQTPKHIVLVTEMIHDARIVPMDERPHLAAEIRRWSGDSRGRWEGNTLVVETTNFTDKTPTYQLPVDLAALDEGGAVGSGMNMHLVERFTRVSASRLDYEYTITDPTTFVTPFTVNIPMRASDGRMFEYACHEGNYALTGMLKGARLLEAEELDAPQGPTGRLDPKTE